jgi:pyruvate,orthophosphate dikinase
LSDLRVDARDGSLQIGTRRIREGDVITLDGGTGEVFAGEVPTLPPKLGGAFDELMSWADRLRRMRVRANADNAQDARAARGMGAEGIGLCRTEHMFFEPDRIQAMRRMILADSSEERAYALEALAPMQQRDFEALFEVMDGLPVTIRLLDPPLHEFLPTQEAEILSVAAELGVPAGALRTKLEALHEWNPMLGHRGCRLGISFPEIYRMQVRAIALAVATSCAARRPVRAEVMVPLVADVKELARVREAIAAEIAEVLNPLAGAPRIPIGTMIEVPRAALTADAIAERADFFSFGTNDLTQMGFALSRDDAGKFLAGYVEEGILPADPFVSIDREGIGALVAQGVSKGRETKPKLKIGVCGEHGGDSRSIHFFESLGMDYVSCSPFRVPVARLAAAQAAVARRSGATTDR